MLWPVRYSFLPPVARPSSFRSSTSYSQRGTPEAAAAASAPARPTGCALTCRVSISTAAFAADGRGASQSAAQPGSLHSSKLADGALIAKAGTSLCVPDGELFSVTGALPASHWWKNALRINTSRTSGTDYMIGHWLQWPERTQRQQPADR